MPHHVVAFVFFKTRLGGAGPGDGRRKLLNVLGIDGRPSLDTGAGGKVLIEIAGRICQEGSDTGLDGLLVTVIIKDK